MRENDSIVRKDRPTVRIGDRVRVCYHGRWVAAVIQGFKDNFVVVKELGHTQRKKWTWSNWGRRTGGRNYFPEDSELWERDPYAYQREKQQRVAKHKEIYQNSINSRQPESTNRSSGKRYVPNRVRNYNPEITKQKKYNHQFKQLPVQPVVTDVNEVKIDDHFKRERAQKKKNVIVYGTISDKRYNWKLDREVNNNDFDDFITEENIDQIITEDEDLNEFAENANTSTEESTITIHSDISTSNSTLNSTQNVTEEIPRSAPYNKHLRKIQKQEQKAIYYQYGGVIPITVKEGPRKTKQEIEAERNEHKIEDYFTIKDKQTLLETQQRENQLLSQGYQKLYLEENFIVHLLDLNSFVLRIEHGPQFIFISPSENIVVGPKERYNNVQYDKTTNLMNETDQLENLKLVGTFNLNFSDEISGVDHNDDDTFIFEDGTTSNSIYRNVTQNEEPKVTFAALPESNARVPRKITPKTWSSRKAVSDYEDDLDSCFSDDFSYSETSSVVSYDDHYSSVGEYYDNDNEHFIIFSNDQQLEVQQEEHRENNNEYNNKIDKIEYKSKTNYHEVISGEDYGFEDPYMYENEEIVFNELDNSIDELIKLKSIFESGFITKGEFVQRRNSVLSRYNV